MIPCVQRLSLLCLALHAALSLAATPAPAVAAAPAPATDPSGLISLDASTSCGIHGLQIELLQRINAARAQGLMCGSQSMPAAPPVGWNSRLFSAAARHSRDMAQNNYFSHTSLDGRRQGQRVANEGYAWSGIGENIAAGQSSVNAVVAGWLSSPGHCTNIMKASYVHVGVSCVQQSGTAYGRYWTMVLANP